MFTVRKQVRLFVLFFSIFFLYSSSSASLWGGALFFFVFRLLENAPAGGGGEHPATKVRPVRATYVLKGSRGGSAQLGAARRCHLVVRGVLSFARVWYTPSCFFARAPFARFVTLRRPRPASDYETETPSPPREYQRK